MGDSMISRDIGDCDQVIEHIIKVDFADVGDSEHLTKRALVEQMNMLGIIVD